MTNRKEIIKEIEFIESKLKGLVTEIGFGLNAFNVKIDISIIVSHLNRLDAKIHTGEILLPKRGLREYVDGDGK